MAEHQHLAEQGVQLVELRLDFIGRAVNLNRLLRNRPCPVVATARRREDGGRWQRSEAERQTLLRSAIASGVEYVDLEADIADAIPRYGQTKRIVSLHDFEQTPENLSEIHAAMAATDADIVKIATMAHSFDDTMRMIRLVREAQIPTIGICMGEIGLLTRILAHRFGSPFTYATFSTDRKLAPGQLNWRQMRDLYRCDAITEATRLFGVTGDPVGHSHSPLIHNTGFIADELDACYLPLRVSPQAFPQFIKACPDLGICGLSVTIPHKERALDQCTQVEAAGHGIGAINTMLFQGEEILGYNTDYRAAMDCLSAMLEPDPNTDKPYTGKTALLLGAGGVARAIAWGLHHRGANVVISSRTLNRAEQLANEMGGNCSAIEWETRHDIEYDMLINGTPVGMHPKVDATPFDDEALRPEAIVFDTIYNPEQTLLIKHARRAGCPVITGVDMFVRQAAYQYKLFSGKEPQPGLMRQAIKDATSSVRVNR